MTPKPKPPDSARWDCVALGEVMLRFDPGAGRVRTARQFSVSEGGGEYNVARALSKVFGRRSAVVTALVDNDLGRLAEDLIGAGGVSMDHVRWLPFDGLGFTRVGLNFTERGFGPRPAVGTSDRAHSAASKLAPADIDWGRLFGGEGVRWFHTGGIFAGLSESTTALAEEGMRHARDSGTVVSYDINHRSSLWRRSERDPVEVTHRLLPHVDVLFGSIGDYREGLALEVPARSAAEWNDDPDRFGAVFEQLRRDFPDMSLAAMSLRDARTASRNDWGGLLATDDGVWPGRFHRDLEIFDRVGGGDGFVSGVVWALLEGRPCSEAVEIGVAHGALTMTTPGDTSTASLGEVLDAVTATDARARR